METSVQINGVEYIRADSVPAAKPNGNRAVVVVDRGWIFAGDVTRDSYGYGYGYGYGNDTCSPHRGMTELSSQAQAVLDAFRAVPDLRDCPSIAAALRAAADSCDPTWLAVTALHHLYAIADELENSND